MTILLTIGSLIIVALFARYVYNKRQKKRLKKNYVNALFGNDIQKAVAAGRAYYQNSNHEVTATAEKAIARDLEKNGLTSQHAPS